MNIRKAQQQAGNVLFLSIPASFRKAHDIKKGDAFTVEEDDQGRLVYTRIEDPSVVDIFGGDE